MSDPELSRSEWRKSGASATGDCAEVAFVRGSVLMRHSQSPAGPVLAFSHSEWAAFVTGVRNGEFDLPGNDPAATDDGPM